MEVEISKRSYQNPQKSRNGDYCEFEMLEQEQLVILALGDGVGSSPCDWNASKLSCEQFIESFKSNPSKEISERIAQSLKAVNQEFLHTGDVCEGMKTTFCGVVWDFANSEIYYVSIGDSRIFEFSNNGLIQISRDEVKSVILRKRDGKPMIIAGVAVTAEGVANVIGSPELTFEVKVKSDDGVEGMVLTTDGMHGASTKFEEDGVRAISAVNLENGLEQLCNNYKDLQKDDMTILAARRIKGGNHYGKLIASILNDEEVSGMSNLELSKALLQGMEAGIKDKDANKVNKLISIAETKRIDLGRAEIGGLISLMFKVDFQDGAIYQQLMSMMRKSKI
jgi:serine/threonine protein phosphatase PrpC